MPLNPSRRRLIFGQRDHRPPPVRPPWSSEASIAAHCTGCGDCAVACPEQIFRLDGRSRPVVDFGRGECTFCGDCAEACVAPVFTARENGPAFPHRMAIGAGCLARRSVFCQTCGDACPEAAIRFRAVLGEPPRPELEADRCTGCGACVGICPVGAIGVVRHERVAADG
jgi:ferredoxin-type protein NapF